MTSKSHFIPLCSLDAVANGSIGIGDLPDGRRVEVADGEVRDLRVVRLP